MTCRSRVVGDVHVGSGDIEAGAQGVHPIDRPIHEIVAFFVAQGVEDREMGVDFGDTNNL